MSRRLAGSKLATRDEGRPRRRSLRSWRLTPGLTMLAWALAAAGCTGTIGGSGDQGGVGPSGPAGPGGMNPGNATGNPGTGGPMTGGPMTGGNLPPPGGDPLEPRRDTPACKDIKPGPAPMRRLTRAEYDNTIRDLLGEDKQLAKGFPGEELQHSFDNSAELRSVSDVLAENYVTASKEIGKAVVGKLGSFLACDPARAGDSACLDQFLDGFARRVWRRPLDTTERADLKAAFAAGRTDSFADGIETVVRVMVLSPQFMYRIESGVAVPGAGYQRLGHWEMASRLSYLLWGTMPDADLFAAAEAGKLGTREEVGRQARRMLDDPRATAMFTNFAAQWLHLRELADAAKDTTVLPAWKDEYQDLFRQETESFAALVWKDDAKLDTLLAAPFTSLNGPLASFYGVKGVTGDAFRKVDLDPAQRAGVLTHASILAEKSGPDQSSPILRGVFVREQMFCQPLPLPPASVDAKPPDLNPNMTTKERFAAHRTDPSCNSCHRLIDAVGFGLEKYDATGAYRTTENGKTIDAAGELIGTDIDGAFDGAIELSKKLVASKQVETCMAANWFTYGFGREAGPVDACTTETLASTFASTGGDLRQLLLAMVQTDAFFFKGDER
jgi:hypothetical protein